VNAARRIVFFTTVLMSFSAASFPVGKSSFMFDDGNGHKIDILIYQPKKFDGNAPIQFVMHGMSRNASEARQQWIPLADRDNVLIVAPYFDLAQFRRTDDYSIGPLRAGQRSMESLRVIEKLFDHVKKETGSKRDGYRIFGHSAGAQFVHRLTLLTPENRAEWAIAANAGRYTWPEWRAAKGGTPLPNGMSDVADAPDKLRLALTRKLVVLLGDEDNDPAHHQLRHGKALDQQGMERFSRGGNFFNAAQSLASELNVRSAWVLKTVPGVGHDNAAMSRAAIELMYPSGAKQ
jgi:pimeloyl-ACP methyl ester carboxylesterase